MAHPLLELASRPTGVEHPLHEVAVVEARQSRLDRIADHAH
jgi:hypothetical protein